MRSLNNLTDDEDTSLWHDLLAGSAPSFEKLIDRTYDMLFQYGNKFSRDRELIKDSIQDVFMEVWEKRTLLNDNIPPKAYLLASLRRRMHRLAQRNRFVPMEDSHFPGIDFHAEFSVEYSLIQSEQDQLTASQMTSLLNDLPKRQKEVIYLKFFNNLDRDDIAAIMDIHPQSVSNLLQTAFKWLKTRWKTAISILLMLQFA